ncbi:hypothetical protein LEMLEM_LOCUS6611, partial [Lemmus lemmus]
MLDQVFAVLVVHLLRRSIYVPGRSGVSTKGLFLLLWTPFRDTSPLLYRFASGSEDGSDSERQSQSPLASLNRQDIVTGRSRVYQENDELPKSRRQDPHLSASWVCMFIL